MATTTRDIAASCATDRDLRECQPWPKTTLKIRGEGSVEGCVVELNGQALSVVAITFTLDIDRLPMATIVLPINEFEIEAQHVRVSASVPVPVV